VILGTLKSKSSDGELILVHPDRKHAVRASAIVPNAREALEKWSEVEPRLMALDQELRAGKAAGVFALKDEDLHSVLPRTWLFADGSAFIHHIRLVRKARNAEPPETLMTVPLMYQGECGRFLAPTEPIPQVDFSHGTDFEAEVGVILDHVPRGVTPEEALKKVRLLVLINDVSLRGLIPAELAAGFGFFVSKPNKALSPFAITPDEMGAAWHGGKIHLPLHVRLNGEFFGRANAGAMHFHFGQLIAHAAQTRDLPAGTLIGSGTVSNEDPSVGSGCLAEKRTLETIKDGKPSTPFMKIGDEVEIWMDDDKGHSLFGKIKQKVAKA
jgi:fumarylacetoacetate (FAA) hydrolase